MTMTITVSAQRVDEYEYEYEFTGMKRSVPNTTTVLGHIFVARFHRLLGAGPSGCGWGHAVPGTIIAIWRVASRATHARFH